MMLSRYCSGRGTESEAVDQFERQPRATLDSGHVLREGVRPFAHGFLAQLDLEVSGRHTCVELGDLAPDQIQSFRSRGTVSPGCLQS